MRGWIDAERVKEAILRDGARRLAQAELAADACAGRMEAQAKRDAPWSDRTGQARQSIRGVAGRAGERIVCGVAGGMAYSPKLELGREGRGAVLWPTVRENAAQVIETCAAAMRGG